MKVLVQQEIEVGSRPENPASQKVMTNDQRGRKSMDINP